MPTVRQNTATSGKPPADVLAPDAFAVFQAPTYYGARHAARGTKGEDFGAPVLPIAVYHAEGVRVVLGEADPRQPDAPDLYVERRPCGWAVFVFPVGGGDPCGVFYMHDDGRSWFTHESPEAVRDGTPRLEVTAQAPPEIDEPPPPPPTPAGPATVPEGLLTLLPELVDAAELLNSAAVPRKDMPRAVRAALQTADRTVRKARQLLDGECGQ